MQGGLPPEPAAWFCKWLEESASDFRVGAAALSHLSFAVFGLGSSAYEDHHFNAVAKQVDAQLGQLGAHRCGPPCCHLPGGGEDEVEDDEDENVHERPLLPLYPCLLALTLGLCAG